MIIDFYRHIKLINRQLLTNIEHYRLIDSFPMIDFRSTCDVLKRLNVFNMNKCEPTIYSQLFPSLASFLYRPANQMIKFPPVAETPYELDFTTAIT